MIHVDYGAPDTWRRIAAALEDWPVRLADSCGWIHCEPTWSWSHRLADFDLWTVVAGSGEAWLAGEHVRLRPGTTLLLRPGDRIDARHRQDDRLTVGHAHYDHVPRRPSGQPRIPESLLPPRVVELDDAAAIQAPLRAAVRRLHRSDPAAHPQAEIALVGILLEIHVQAARRAGHLPPPMDQRIRSVVDLIRAQPARRWTLGEAAARGALSPEHFSRLFREQSGETFRDFCVAARMDRARDLLAETGLSVAEIARMLGYGDYRLFARQFTRRHAGSSPTEWRIAQR